MSRYAAISVSQDKRDGDQCPQVMTMQIHPPQRGGVLFPPEEQPINGIFPIYASLGSACQPIRSLNRGVLERCRAYAKQVAGTSAERSTLQMHTPHHPRALYQTRPPRHESLACAWFYWLSPTVSMCNQSGGCNHVYNQNLSKHIVPPSILVCGVAVFCIQVHIVIILESLFHAFPVCMLFIGSTAKHLLIW